MYGCTRANIHFRTSYPFDSPRPVDLAAILESALTDSCSLNPQQQDTCTYNFSITVKDVSDLANWEFRPTGFPNLLIITYGDFSGIGLPGRTKILLCRNSSQSGCFNNNVTSTSALQPTYFWVMNSNDDHLFDHIEEGREML